MSSPEEVPTGPPPEIEATPKLEKYVPGYELYETQIVDERRQAVEEMFQGDQPLSPDLLQELGQKGFIENGKQLQERGEVKRLIPDRYFTDDVLKVEIKGLLDSLQGSKPLNELLEAAAVSGSTDKKRAGLEAFRVVGARLLQEHGITKEQSWAQLSEDDKRVSRLAEAMILGAEAKAVQLAKREKNITPAAVKEYTDKFTRVLSRYPSNRADIAPTIHQQILEATENLPPAARPEKPTERAPVQEPAVAGDTIPVTNGEAVNKIDDQPSPAEVFQESMNKFFKEHGEHFRNHPRGSELQYLEKKRALLLKHMTFSIQTANDPELHIKKQDLDNQIKALHDIISADMEKYGPLTNARMKEYRQLTGEQEIPDIWKFQTDLMGSSDAPAREAAAVGVEATSDEESASTEQEDEEPAIETPPIVEARADEEEIPPGAESDIDNSPLPDNEPPETPTDSMRETETAAGVVVAGTKNERRARPETDTEASTKLVQGFKQISGQRNQKRMDELFDMAEIAKMTKEFSKINHGLAVSLLVADQIMARFEKRKDAINEDPDSLRALQKQLGKSRELFERMAKNQDGSIDDLLRSIVARQKRIKPDKVKQPDIDRLQRSYTRVQKELSERIEVLEAYFDTTM